MKLLNSFLDGISFKMRMIGVCSSLKFLSLGIRWIWVYDFFSPRLLSAKFNNVIYFKLFFIISSLTRASLAARRGIELRLNTIWIFSSFRLALVELLKSEEESFKELWILLELPGGKLSFSKCDKFGVQTILIFHWVIIPSHHFFRSWQDWCFKRFLAYCAKYYFFLVASTLFAARLAARFLFLVAREFLDEKWEEFVDTDQLPR